MSHMAFCLLHTVTHLVFALYAVNCLNLTLIVQLAAAQVLLGATEVLQGVNQHLMMTPNRKRCW